MTGTNCDRLSQLVEKMIVLGAPRIQSDAVLLDLGARTATPVAEAFLMRTELAVSLS